MKTITKTLPTGITTTQQKVDKKIIITVNKKDTKNVTSLQKLVVGFLFSLVFLCGGGLMIDIFTELSSTGKFFFSPLFIGNFYLLFICSKGVYSFLKT
tara:strand:- start:31 stop:324 length:294 start_codon:yes stop_codon:yes gene_type:complete